MRPEPRESIGWTRSKGKEASSALSAGDAPTAYKRGIGYILFRRCLSARADSVRALSLASPTAS